MRAKKCRKCKNHGVNSLYRFGHKLLCPYAECKCILCEFVDLGRKINNFTKALEKNQVFFKTFY